MNRLLSSLLIPLFLLSGCATQDPDEVNDSNVGLNPGARSEGSIEGETALLTALGDSCEKAVAEGVTEATAEGVRMVLLPENLPFESYRAFSKTREGQSELIFSLDYFLVCDLHLNVANYLDQNSDEDQGDKPLEVTMLGQDKFKVTLDGITTSQRTYVIKDGLLIEVILAEGTVVSIELGAYLPEDLAEIESLVKTLYG